MTGYVQTSHMHTHLPLYLILLLAQSCVCHVYFILVGEQHLPEVAGVCGGAIRKGRPFLQHPALVRQLV